MNNIEKFYKMRNFIQEIGMFPFLLKYDVIGTEIPPKIINDNLVNRIKNHIIFHLKEGNYNVEEFKGDIQFGGNINIINN